MTNMNVCKSKWAGLTLLVVALLFSVAVFGVGVAGNRFSFVLLQHDGDWNPYPSVPQAVLDALHTMTNIPLSRDIRSVTLSNPSLFETPVLMVKGNSALTLNAAEKANLKAFIERGGFVFFDDTLADSKSPFARSVRDILKELFPAQSLRPLASDHAVFRSFFLLRSPAGRRMDGRFLEGLDLEGSGGGEARTAVVYCAHDVMGAWVKDPLGRYAYSCEPGGEAQRWEAFKMMVNVIYFSLTGTYKNDAVHQPFIERKLGF
jgi:hypothetical protein